MQDLMELVNECEELKTPEGIMKLSAAEETAQLLKKAGMKAASAKVMNRVRPIVKLAQIAAHKYIEITPEKIQAFLDRKAKAYNDAKPKRSSLSSAAYSMYETSTGLMLAQDRLRALAHMNSAINSAGSMSLGATSQISLGATTQWSYEYFNQPRVDNSFRDVFCRLAADTVDRASSANGTIGRFQWDEFKVQAYDRVPPRNIVEKLIETAEKNLFDYFTIAEVNGIKDPLLLGRIQEHESRFFIAQWGDDVSLDEII